MFGNNFKNRITRSITADATILALATMAHATNVACVGNSITEGYESGPTRNTPTTCRKCSAAATRSRTSARVP